MRRAGGGGGEALARAVRALERDHLEPRLLRSATPPPISALASWDSVVAHLGLETWIETHANSGAVAVFTKLLSYPLTLAKFAHALEDASRKPEDKPEDPVRVSVVGARAESSLPALYWEHLAALSPHAARWHLQFIGPDASTAGPPVHDVLRSDEGAAMRRVSFASASCALQECELPDPDLYVFFNSGIGHPQESKRWARALQDLRGSGRRAIFTSFHAADLARDLDALGALGAEVDLVVRENPLRSLAREPSKDPEERVFANAAAVVARL